MKSFVCLFLVVLFVAACAAPTSNQPPGDPNALRVIPAGHIGISGKLLGAKAGYQVFLFSYAKGQEDRATVIPSGDDRLILPEHLGKAILSSYHDKNGNGSLDEGEYSMGPGTQLMLDQESLSDWDFSCVATRTLTTNLFIAAGVVTSGSTVSVGASDPTGHDGNASS